MKDSVMTTLSHECMGHRDHPHVKNPPLTRPVVNPTSFSQIAAPVDAILKKKYVYITFDEERIFRVDQV